MSATLHAFLATPLDPEVERAVERLRLEPDIARIALMPDVHLAHEVCVGTVIGSRSRLYPAAVGGDIGCGMAALAFDGDASLLDDPAVGRRLLDRLSRLVPPLVRPPGQLLPMPENPGPLSHKRLDRLRDREARRQLGTLGRGNHFLELQADETGRLWVMVHSGSRGLGPAIRDHHLERASTGPSGLASLDAESDAGRAYLQDLGEAIAFAEANREALLLSACVALEAELGLQPLPGTLRRCQHNHVRRECWNGEELLVHRKGAIPAAEGEPGIIPGSMGSPSFHTTGRGCPEALGSSSHGAGRRMSRSEARMRISTAELRRQMRGTLYQEEQAPALVEEAPSAYRDIGAVMRAQRDLCRIERRLWPRVSYKAAGA